MTLPDADLDICEQEPLEWSGRIQDHGALIVCDRDGRITHLSENWSRYFDDSAVAEPQTLQDILADRIDYFHHREQELYGSRHSLIRNVVTTRDIEGHLMCSRHANRLYYEFEPVMQPSPWEAPEVRVEVKEGALPDAIRIEQILRRAHERTRFPKCMLYRFLPDGSGEVVAELTDGTFPDYLGLRFPASDIPQIARTLYIDNPFRVIYDTQAPTVAVLPVGGAAPNVDLSTVNMRSVSPVHLEYLANMQVRASISFSLRITNKFWGLLAMHSADPVQHDVLDRASLRRLLDQELAHPMMNHTISEEHRRFNAQPRLLEDATAALVVALISDGTDNSWNDALAQLVQADALVVCLRGQPLHGGDYLTQQELDAILSVARQYRNNGQFMTDQLERYVEQSASTRAKASGLLYASTSEGLPFPPLEILWLRRENRTLVHWAGRPEKLISRDDAGDTRVSPRQSFERWSEEARGTSLAWSDMDLVAASKLMVKVVTRMAAVQQRRNSQ